ncbi:hypothetical protein ACA910_012856 [Epithemia clementina (nom. ined.)]
MQHDEAFLSLLSSQRQLLSQLSSEKVIRQPTDGAFRHQRSQPKPLFLNRSLNGTSNHTTDQVFPHQEMILSRRFSMGLNAEKFLLPSFSVDDDPTSSMLDISGHSRQSGKKRSKQDDNYDVLMWKKRRFSSTGYGFLSESAFDDDAEPVAINSIVSWVQDVAPCEEPVYVTISDHQESDSDDESSSGSAFSVEPIRLDAIGADPSELKKAMEDFNKAMEKSQKSQQDIHDWDRKMGLKRSHSKTMRLSSRSRKQLRAILKREISGLRP